MELENRLHRLDRKLFWTFGHRDHYLANMVAFLHEPHSVFNFEAFEQGDRNRFDVSLFIQIYCLFQKANKP
jgi:hypothetical protein